MKRKISDVIYRQLVADAQLDSGPGRASGDDSHSQRDRPNPDGRHFGQATARTQPKLYAPRQHRLTEGCHYALDQGRLRLGVRNVSRGVRRSIEESRFTCRCLFDDALFNRLFGSTLAPVLTGRVSSSLHLSSAQQ